MIFSFFVFGDSIYFILSALAMMKFGWAAVRAAPIGLRLYRTQHGSRPVPTLSYYHESGAGSLPWPVTIEPPSRSEP